MTVIISEIDFSICKLGSLNNIPTGDFCFIAKTNDEISLVCPSAVMPQDALVADAPWRMLRVSGVLDFSLVGIISKISSTLAQAGIPIFAVSTFDTDYIFVRKEFLGKAISCLQQDGYEIILQ